MTSRRIPSISSPSVNDRPPCYCSNFLYIKAGHCKPVSQDRTLRGIGLFGAVPWIRPQLLYLRSPLLPLHSIGAQTHTVPPSEISLHITYGHSIRILSGGVHLPPPLHFALLLAVVRPLHPLTLLPFPLPIPSLMGSVDQTPRCNKAFTPSAFQKPKHFLPNLCTWSLKSDLYYFMLITGGGAPALCSDHLDAAGSHLTQPHFSV